MISGNTQYVLIAGESAAGKSASLRNLKNPEGVLYLNCEVNKPLPFPNKFFNHSISDPQDIFPILDDVENQDDIHTVVIDSLTFLMDMVETQYVNQMDGYDGWAFYSDFFKKLMYEHIGVSSKRILVLAHTLDILDKDKNLKTQVPIKGALKNNGVESFFTTVIYATKASVKDLMENYSKDNDLLHISEEEELLGYKHVFQTKITRKTIHSRIRSPMGLFTKEQTFMDNDAELLLTHMHQFYHG